MKRHVTNSNPLSLALKRLTYGLYIVTAKHDNDIAAGTVQWVTQASFNPPLVAICIQQQSHLNSVIRQSGFFAVNVVGKEQQHFIAPFSKETKVEKNQLNNFPFQEGKSGSPLLIDLPAFTECKIIESIDKGDHTIFIGEVINAGVREEDMQPLVEWETPYHYGG